MSKLGTVPSSLMAATALKKAREVLENGRKLTNERQKLIKIADRSDLHVYVGGGRIKSTFPNDPHVADNSGDEKGSKRDSQNQH